MQGSARKDVVFGAAGVYPVTVPGPKWKSWFNGSRAEDAWLLAAWERNANGWSFRYFTIEMNAAIPFPPPSES